MSAENVEVVRRIHEAGGREESIRELVAGGDDVVVLGRYTASGSSSGIALEGEHGYVWTVRDGLAVRFQWFQSHREALEAAGAGNT
jgi:ketosteroid isomerase-like protein